MTPTLKVSDTFAVDDLLKMLAEPPTDREAKFKGVDWSEKQQAALGKQVIILAVDDDDATLKVQVRDEKGEPEGDFFWICYSWIIKLTDPQAKLKLEYEEGQRQLAYVKKRQDFQSRVAFGWTPPFLEWKIGDVVVIEPRGNIDEWVRAGKDTIGKEGTVVTIRTSGNIVVEFTDSPVNYVYPNKHLKWLKRPNW